MIRSTLILLALIFLHAFSCHGVMTIGSLSLDVETASSIERFIARFATEKLSYTVGGVTFTYPTVPTNLFTQTPTIRLSVEPSAAHPDTETYTAEVSANSATSTTIKAYKISGGVVSEASTGSITIHFLAMGI